jgi:hypothetical protein
MGTNYLNDYIVYWEQKTWLEARDVCMSIGGALQFTKWSSVNWYIKTKSGRQGWYNYFFIFFKKHNKFKMSFFRPFRLDLLWYGDFGTAV